MGVLVQALVCKLVLLKGVADQLEFPTVRLKTDGSLQREKDGVDSV